MAMNTPNNPKKAPNIPTGPRAGEKGVSKPMKPMSKAGKSVPRGGKVSGSRSVNPKASSQTVDGGPRR